ncbi:hypothetical protein [Oryza sativa Japonica Group]|uniref:Uncharacterized protein n=1 Tax=Oryza sativa subsp. japonica TaxID=39947 RepID=Q5N7L6_ORYSJ|nr:hypothetical protein [Oryza sativa Japonica Group]
MAITRTRGRQRRGGGLSTQHGFVGYGREGEDKVARVSVSNFSSTVASLAVAHGAPPATALPVQPITSRSRNR